MPIELSADPSSCTPQLFDDTQDKCPGTLVFVLKELDPENWINGGGNFTVVLRQPDSSSIVRKVRQLESERNNAWVCFRLRAWKGSG